MLHLDSDHFMNKVYNSNLFFFLSVISILVTYHFFLIPANIDLSDGAYSQFMDEQIFYDAIQSILNSNNFSEVFSNYAFGDQRYGRIIYLIGAAIAYFPEKFWGETGQIIATRFLFSSTLFFSYLLFAYVFLKENISRIILFLLLMAIPTTAYYSTMPKPEPFLFLFFAIFCYFYFLKMAGSGYFIFLGLAYGCKVSLLIVVALIFLKESEFLSHWPIKFKVKFLWNNIKIKLFYFVIGLGIAVPILPLSLINPSGIRSYLGATLFNTRHGADVEHVNIFTWVHGIIFDWIQAPTILTIVVFIFILAFIFFRLSLSFREKLYTLDRFKFTLIVAILSIFSILFLVKRLWYMYLTFGLVFALIALMISIEFVIARSKMHRYFGWSIILLCVLFSIFYLFPQQKSELISLSNRTKTNEYKIEKAKYNLYVGLLNKAKIQKTGREISAFVDPYLFRFYSNEFKIEQFWGPFIDWEKGYDFVVLTNQSNPKFFLPPYTLPKNCSICDISATKFNQFVDNHKSKIKYHQYLSTNDGMAIYQRIN
jgi:hypothetical protein